jgi:DNA-binding beta-propeller fold protein YncE
MMSAQAGIVEPVYKQLKDPSIGRDPSPVSMSITPDGKKMFVLNHFDKKYYIYDLTTPFDISTMDVSNRSIVNMIEGSGVALTTNINKDIEFNNDGTKVFVLIMLVH